MGGGGKHEPCSEYFSLTAINDKIYAVGGMNDKGKQNSVESFSHAVTQLAGRSRSPRR